MAKINLDNINTIQFDVLKEIGNIGAGNATSALAQLLNTKIDMSVPNVALLPFKCVTKNIGTEDDVIVGILITLDGDINGMMMFLMDLPSAHHIVNLLMGSDFNKSDEFSEIELSALNEVGNIISGAYLSSLSSLTGLSIVSSIPSTTIDMAGALLSVPAIEFGKIGDKVLLIQTQFGEDELVNGFFVLVPELDSYNKILSSLGI